LNRLNVAGTILFPIAIDPLETVNSIIEMTSYVSNVLIEFSPFTSHQSDVVNNPATEDGPPTRPTIAVDACARDE
jgi:hypothetical protein